MPRKKKVQGDKTGPTNKKLDSDHQPKVPAPHLYLVLPEPKRETNLCAQFKQYGLIQTIWMTNAATSTNNNVFKLASVKYSEFPHASKSFEECDPAYRPKYSGYYSGSSSSTNEAKRKEQE